MILPKFIAAAIVIAIYIATTICIKTEQNECHNGIVTPEFR
jgi:hypothetical protein